MARVCAALGVGGCNAAQAVPATVGARGTTAPHRASTEEMVVAKQHKFLPDESQMPPHWYNVVPDLPSPPPPPLHPGTHQPVGPDDLAPLFPMDLIEQEVSGEQYVDIPGGVLDVYRIWRPSPLIRARRLEKLLDTPAKIF